MAKGPKTTEAQYPSNLSWRRSIDVSDGFLYNALPGGESTPVLVEEIGIRGPMSHVSALANDESSKANIQHIDRATLSEKCDTLELRFSVAFHDASRAPDVCNLPKFRELLGTFVSAAATAGLYEDLAARYVWNLVNGRVLWRNGYGSSAGVSLSWNGGSAEGSWALFPQERFPGKAEIDEAYGELVDKVTGALRGEGVLAVDVSVRSRLYNGAEVWPSQEFVEAEQKKRGSREISRVLSSRRALVDGEAVRHGTMHSQKIGNAVRTIDEWHGVAGYGATPVEAYGWLQRESKALRAGGPGDGIDFYKALRALPALIEGIDRTQADGGRREDALYVLAMIIRGGVFGAKDDTKAGTEGADAAPAAEAA